MSYDPMTGKLLCFKTWRYRNAGDILGRDNGNGYLRASMFGVDLYVHQWAFFFMTDDVPPYIDHRDGDGFNNEWENLRGATQSQNMANGNSRSGKFRGVYRHSLGHKWAAAITKDYRTKYLGLFDKEEDAARAYNVAAQHMFGDYARLNKI